MLAQPEFALNPEPRCPCVLVLDCSSSMDGSAIEQLEGGVRILDRNLKDDPVASVRVEVAVIEFGGDVRSTADFVTADDFEPPRLVADGGTPMGEAIVRAVDALECRKTEYKASGVPYYRPWIFLITDGAPTDEWGEAARLVHAGEREGRFSFFAVGVEGADMNVLSRVAPPNRPPLKLRGLDFAGLFAWMSDSVRAVSCQRVNSGEQQALPPVDGWAQVGT